jgi:D,D-heptose 1,7-bisphosphate phosphatase
MLTRQAILLVGGKGTRLGALTANTPKPLMPLDAGTVFLDEVLLDVARHGFDDIILAAGYLAGQFVERYHGRAVRGAHIRVHIEAEPAGTGGALREVAHWLAPTFLLANGDTAFDINLRRLDQRLARDVRAQGVLALRRVEDAGRYGSVTLDQGRIACFSEKQPDTVGAGGLINGGIGLFRREILDRITSLPCSIEADIYPQLVAEGRLLGHEFAGYFLDIGLPETLAQARRDLAFRRSRPTVFFDRDGVLNRDSGYTWRPESLQFMPGAVEAVRAVNDMGALAIVITNQAGVAHGLYGPDDVDIFHAALQAGLVEQGAHIDAFYCCPFHPDAAVDAWRHPDHPDRKPNPGMILRAMSEWPAAPGASLLVGDKPSDMEAAARAGIEGVLYTEGNLNELLAPHLAALASRAALAAQA